MPLAIKFSDYYEVIGFDKEKAKIKNFNSERFSFDSLNMSLINKDKTNFKKILFTHDENLIQKLIII